MAGCEFVLAAGSTQVMVGPAGEMASVTLQGVAQQQVLFIALDQDACSFEVMVDAPGGQSIRGRLLQASPAPWQHWPLQQQQVIGGLQVAFRLSAQAWNLQPAPAPSVRRGRWYGSLHRGAGVLALCLLLTSLGVWSLPDRTVSEQQRSVSALVSTHAQVLQGRDQLIYVLVDSQREASWIRQVLMRHQLQGVALIVTAQEQQRLEQQLLTLEPGLALRLLDLSEPQRPLLVLAGEPLEQGLKERLEQQLLRLAPYAEHLEFRLQDDRASVEQAIAGLRQIGVPFRREDPPGSVALRIEGNLQDSQLEAVRRFIRRFEQQWGTGFVHFSIVLQDDRLKGLSYQVGEQGYIKPSSTSWQFQSTHTGT
ncbi:PrgH/EprH family type III secretion apparatus protein [Pseudomonas sp. BJa5]|uniref:PrgH/EprH family type III secretion apparatus protein n=1 Tax=Pseudomonas sp. BJa5 TaxID=2936270 RepID=UPI00255A1EA3|nr:PrgH/EprH family type III secretion apparatus protein [Pseudomonas sp. BGr12]MDL2421184.1 PrgH/EprH family type III secretion apparatus protein [Pseudomonas sp. BGr12]